MTGEELDRVWFAQCTRKHSYATQGRAERAAKSAERVYGKPFCVYRCAICPGWHTTSSPALARAA